MGIVLRARSAEIFCVVQAGGFRVNQCSIAPQLMEDRLRVRMGIWKTCWLL